MKLVYTHPNPMVVENAKNICLNAGLAVEVHNQFASGAVGELAPINAWPELWVTRDRDYEPATRLIERAFKGEEDTDWDCSHCGEHNSPSFEICWHCQQPRYGLRCDV